MWLDLGIAAWWLLGTSSMLWLQRGNGDVTWGQLLGCCLLGLLGPGLWVIIGFAVLCQADFWGQPIFKRNKSD